MNSNIKKILASVLCCTVMLGSIGATAFAVASDKKEAKENKTVEASTNENDSKLQKDETVYVLAGADGSVNKIIVSDWIKNTLGSASFEDKSDLSDIENVKGDETYSINGENMKVWDAQNNDIYYRGNIQKELPVNISVSYKLDGKSISPKELAGKSGKVTIRFDYTNNQYETVEIDGKNEKIYVPFAMITGMMLDNDVFRNVEVSNGKLVNDGTRTIVAGLAFPGLQSNLNISKEKLDVPDYIEINADVKNFELTNTVTLATNEIFNRLNSEELDSADALTGSLDQLSSAMTQLMDGSSQLYDGLCTLLNKSGELVSGINKLAQGAEQLKNGAATLDNGAAELSSGAKSLADGLGELSSNSNALKAGSTQVFESLLNVANTQIAAAGLTVPALTIENYETVLNGVLASLDETAVENQARETARKTVTDNVNAQKDTIKAGVTAAVRENVELGVLKAMGMTKEQYDAGVDSGAVSAEVQASVNAAVEAQMQTEKVQKTIADQTDAKIAELIESNMNTDNVKNGIAAAVQKAKKGAEQITALKAQLDEYKVFYDGVYEYTDGVDTAKGGADALSAGSVTLKNGTAELTAYMTELYNGILTLKNGAPALVDGVTALRDGSMKLSDGLKEFNEKGVKKLTDAVDGDLGGLVTRVKATIDVSKNYKSFSGISDEMDGQVKFIYRTDSIKAD